MKLCLQRMCLDFSLYILLHALTIVDCLSQYMHTADMVFDHLGMSYKKWHSHSTSLVALSKAMNSNSIVEHEMHVCLDDFQDIVAPSKVKIYPLMDLESFILDIQFASEYPLSTAGY